MIIQFAWRHRFWILLTAAQLLLALWLFPWQHPRGIPLDQVMKAELATLNAPVHVDFENVPLSQVLATLAAEAHCQITPNWSSIRDTTWRSPNPTPDTPVYAHAPGTITLEQALDLLIGNWRTSLTIADANSDDVSETPVTVVYNVADLIRLPRSDEEEFSSTSLADFLRSPNDGSDRFTADYDDKLIVRRPRHEQRKIAEVLLKLRGQ